MPSPESTHTGAIRLDDGHVPAIRFDRVTKRFGDHTVLDGLDFVVRKGDRVTLIGPSGSGKTTILRLVMTLEELSDGYIFIDGQPLTHELRGDKRVALKEKHRNEMRKRIGMVFQQFNLLANSPVLENVALPLRLQGRRGRDRALQMLEFVRMADHRDKHPARLSGGEKQRVAIARALVTRPRILLCDEPTSALDSGHTEEVMDVLRKVRREFSTTIVLVSHELETVKSSCDRAVVLEEGRIAAHTDVTPPPPRERSGSYAQRAAEFLA